MSQVTFSEASWLNVLNDAGCRDTGAPDSSSDIMPRMMVLASFKPDPDILATCA